MVVIFNGKKVASEIEGRLKAKTSGKEPRVLHSIIVGDKGGALQYQKLKQAAAERVGAKLIIDQFNDDVSLNELVSKIQHLGSDNSVDGIMIQLPLPGRLNSHTQELINTIAKEKDVDGMRPACAGRDDSPFVAPVVAAVMIALDEAEKTVRDKKDGPLTSRDRPLTYMKTLVVGSSGFTGSKIIRHLADKRYAVVGVDDTSHIDPNTRSADIIISATGVQGIITADIIKDGSILIDVGAPQGDIAIEAYNKASFITPVPGGIGPVTIACLMENLIST